MPTNEPTDSQGIAAIRDAVRKLDEPATIDDVADAAELLLGEDGPPRDYAGGPIVYEPDDAEPVVYKSAPGFFTTRPGAPQTYGGWVNPVPIGRWRRMWLRVRGVWR